jgi:hypothetical protein
MPLILRVMVLCATDDIEIATESVFRALNAANFDSASPVIDFAVGVEGRYEMSAADYVDGAFLRCVRDGERLQPANDGALLS